MSVSPARPARPAAGGRPEPIGGPTPRDTIVETGGRAAA
jgi:hypothetical protein